MQEAITMEEQSRIDADLIVAIKASDTSTVVSLLEQGADPNLTTEYDLWGFGPRPVSALMLAITWFCRRETSGFNPATIEEFNDPLVRALIEGGASLNPPLPGEDAVWYDELPLYTVVQFGELCPNRYDLAGFMLDRGAAVNATFVCSTALHEACAKGDAEMVRLLLNRGADIDATTDYDSPLMRAVKRKQKEVVTILLERGANVHYRAADGQTALSLAQGKGRALTGIRKMLEAAGAKPDMLAAECQQLIEIVEKADAPELTIAPRWRELWYANLEGEKFNHVCLPHVQLLCRLGILLAVSQNEYANAMGLINRLFSHPQSFRLGTVQSLDLHAEQIHYLLLNREEKDAIALARKLMAGAGFDPSYGRSRVRAILTAYFLAQAQHIPVSEELTSLTWDLSQQVQSRPLKNRRLAEQATPHELLALLPRRDRIEMRPIF